METVITYVSQLLADSLEKILDKDQVLDDLVLTAKSNPALFRHKIKFLLDAAPHRSLSQNNLDVCGKTIPDGSYFNVINKNYIQKKFKYQLGLNIDTEPFNPTGSGKSGGLYFATALNLPTFFDNGELIVEVKIPNDAKVYVEKNKMKANKIIISNPIEIKDWSYWSDENYCLKMIGKYPELIKYVKNPTDSIYLAMLKSGIDTIKLIPKERINDEMHKVFLKIDGNYIKNISDPSEELCLVAVRSFSSSLQHIKHPTDKVVKESLKFNSSNMEYIKEPITNELFDFILKNYGIKELNCPLTDEQARLAVKYKAENILYIKNRSTTLIEMVLNKNGLLLKYIPKYTYNMAKIAVTQNPDALIFINMEIEELAKIAVSKRGMLLSNIEYPTTEIIQLAVIQDSNAIKLLENKYNLILKAVEANGLTIEHLDSSILTDEVINIALNQNGHAIKFIENPTEEQQMLAIKNKYTSIKFINNLTLAAKKYAETLYEEVLANITV